MAIDRQAAWIKKYGETKAVKKWLAENPPPADFTGTPEQWAYTEMPEDGPIDDPIEPDPDDMPEVAVSRQEHDELRERVVRMTKRFNRAIKSSRLDVAPSPKNPPAPAVPAPQAGQPARRGFLDPLRNKKA